VRDADSVSRLEPQKRGCQYKFWTEFQSHEPEFDYLKSLEIEEKINKIKWCKRQNRAHFLLSTNGAGPRGLIDGVRALARVDNH
jgi:hypothetical protein